jgi:hypothetical protein
MRKQFVFKLSVAVALDKTLCSLTLCQYARLELLLAHDRRAHRSDGRYVIARMLRPATVQARVWQF